MDRFDSILAAVQRTKPGDNLVGRKTQAASLCKVLEEVSALYSWDRPALHSPVKKGRKAEQKLGNAVMVVTRLPDDFKELDRFLGAGVRKKTTTGRELADTFTSKRIKSQFSGELNIALHILDTGEGFNGERGEVAQLFNRALKEMRGGVLPLSSLSTLYGTKVDTNSQCSTLLCSSRSIQRMSSSAAVQAHLAEVGIPSKVLDKTYMKGQVKMGVGVLGVEFVKCAVELSELKSRGFVRNTFFKPGQLWKESFTVWSDKSPAFSAVLLYLKENDQCLVMGTTDNTMAVMFYQTNSSAFFCIMDKVESHFYHKLLSLDSHTPTITLTEKINRLIKEIKTLQFSPSKKHLATPKPVYTQLDMSIIESWRLPDIPAPQILTSLKASSASRSDENSFYHKLMLGVRESYNKRGVKKMENMTFESKANIGTSGTREVFKDKDLRLNLSSIRIVFYIFHIFRLLGESNTSSCPETAADGETEEIDTATYIKGTVFASKPRTAADYVLKPGDPSRETEKKVVNSPSLYQSCIRSDTMKPATTGSLLGSPKHMNKKTKIKMMKSDQPKPIKLAAWDKHHHNVSGSQMKNTTKTRGGREFFSIIDIGLSAGTTRNAINLEDDYSFDASDSYALKLLNMFENESLACASAKLVGEDGHIVSLPLPVLCLAWPSLALIVSEVLCCSSDISICLPCKGPTLIHLKELIFTGRTSYLTPSDEWLLLDFLDKVGLKWTTARHCRGEEQDEETVLIGESFDDSDEEEDNSCKDLGLVAHFWKPKEVQSQVSSRKLCSPMCVNDCQEVVKTWKENDIKMAKDTFSGSSACSRKSQMLIHLQHQHKFGAETVTYVLLGHPFCVGFLNHLTGCSVYLLETVLKDYRRGVRQYEHGNSGIIKNISVASMGFIAWFKNFLSIYGQNAPDSQVLNFERLFCFLHNEWFGIMAHPLRD